MALATDAEVPRLRIALRDLVALSTIPAAWIGREPLAIAAGLADVLVGSLQLDFAFVRLCDPNGDIAAEATRGSGWLEFPEWLRAYLADTSRLSRKEVVSDVGDDGPPRRGIIIPVGIDAGAGLVAAATRRRDFPAEIDQLLLSVAASHAATAFQNARLIHERKRAEIEVRRARDDLEMKVLERTAELRKAAEERSSHLRFLESLDGVNRAIQSANGIEQMMSNVLDTVLSVFQCDRALLLYPCDPSAASCRVAMERTVQEFPSIGALEPELPVDDSRASIFRAASDCGAPVQFGPDSEQPIPKAGAERFSIQSGIAVAVNARVDRQYLFELHQCSYARVWAPAEERLLMEIGRRLSDGLTTLLMFRNLRMSEARLAEAQRIAHVAYWEHDLDTDRVAMSDEAYRIFGLTPRDGWMTLATAEALVHPDDRALMRRALSAALAGGPRCDLECRVIRPDGDVRVIYGQGDVVRDESGVARRMFGTIQDITERRRAERLTTKIFETMPDTAFVVDRDYRLRRANAIFERTWQVQAANSVGMHVAELVGEEFEQRLKPSLDRCFAGEVVRYGAWLDLPCGRRYRSPTFSPLRTAGRPQIDAALVIVRDLTDYMLASEALEEAQAELAHVTRVTTMGEITASIAHEVNQPLAAVVMSGIASRRWLEADPPNVSEARRGIECVVENAKRASEVVRRIRSLLRRQPPEQARIDFGEIVRETLALTQGELARRRVTARAEVDADLPPAVGDRVGLQQVLVNLVLNAADAMAGVGESCRLVVIRCRLLENEQVVVVEVQDCGKGLDPEHPERIFEPFFSTKPAGLGMGLAISRSIVQAHRGRLWATRNSGPGTTFHFTVPLQVEGST